MDLDGEIISLKRKIAEIQGQIAPFLAAYEAHLAGGEPLPTTSAPALARRHLANGDLPAAGKAVGLDRAHAGAEPDESYERRIRASLDGAEAAGAAAPRPADKIHVAEPLKSEPIPTPQAPKSVDGVGLEPLEENQAQIQNEEEASAARNEQRIEPDPNEPY